MGDYYDVDDILAEAEPIPCTFLYEAMDLGYLDSGRRDLDDLAKNSKVDLPYWLAHRLLDRKYVSCELPAVFRPQFQRNLRADPQHAALKDRCYYYYEVGLKLALLRGDQQLRESLQAVLAERMKLVIQQSVLPRQRTGDAAGGTAGSGAAAAHHQDPATAGLSKSAAARPQTGVFVAQRVDRGDMRRVRVQEHATLAFSFTTPQLRKLCHLEESLFLCRYMAEQDKRRWRNGDTTRIAVSHSAQLQRQRKRKADEALRQQQQAAAAQATMAKRFGQSGGQAPR